MNLETKILNTLKHGDKTMFEIQQKIVNKKNITADIVYHAVIRMKSGKKINSFNDGGIVYYSLK